MENADNWHGKAVAEGEELDKALAELGPLNLGDPVQIESPQPVVARADRAVTTECEPPDYPSGEDVATRGGYGIGLAKTRRCEPECCRFRWRY